MPLLHCFIPHCGLLLIEDDLLFALPCYFPTCHLFRLAVLPTCYLLHDSRLFGPTLRPSAPVFRCHPVFLDTREAGTCAGSRACFTLLSFLDFSAPVDFCRVIQAAIE